MSIIDGVDFDKLTTEEAIPQLQKMYFKDMIWYTSILIMMLFALSIAGVPDLVAAAILLPMIVMMFSDINSAYDRRIEQYIILLKKQVWEKYEVRSPLWQ